MHLSHQQLGLLLAKQKKISSSLLAQGCSKLLLAHWCCARSRHSRTSQPTHSMQQGRTVVLAGQVGLGGLGGVELQALADALTQHVQRGVGLHDLGQGLHHQGLDPREPVAEGAVQVVGQVHAHHAACPAQ